MSNNRLIKIGALVLIIALSLAWVTDTSLAQGPGGGRGNGNGNGNGGQGFGQQNGNGNQNSNQNGGCMNANCGQGFGRQNGNGGQGFGQQYGGQMGTCPNCLGNLPAAVPGEVPADVIEALTAGLTDEHNAYNTYQAVIDQLGAVRPFTNIQQAEAQHIATLEFLFERYDLAVPEIAPMADVPPFATLAEACAAGAAAEVANFGLYDQWIATVQNYPDMVQVFTALRNASEFNHLPAFQNCAG